MKIIFIGCVKFSYRALNAILEKQNQNIEVVGVVTKKTSPFNSDFCSLEDIAKENDIPCYIAETKEQKLMLEWIEQFHADVIYCFGWSHLLSSEILNVPKLGVVGFHPALLPYNRGRHPIIWALALGLKETGSSFFFMDEGADSGEILSQEKIIVDHSDNATTLYEKISIVAINQIQTFTLKLAENNYKTEAQDHTKANTWRKRTKKDGEIDWKMSAKSIYNLVRALTKPYVGAHCDFSDKEVKIWNGRIEEANTDEYRNIEPGKVIEVNENEIVIKCGEGLFTITDHEFEKKPERGSYL
ncbi:methionyl-tRNA formyltransferase [Virgibacillus byunsanensis]|uniref:Methionyl-tRNA formyltransferase n=1 Tax=Virgibacillus byunsanensis TaxID=570945 RepID=A0ABW3LFP3_9BACI